MKILQCSFQLTPTLCSSPARPTISNSGPQPSEVTVTQGSEVSLECQAEGIPEPAVTWLKDGRALGSDRDVAVLAGGRVLRLERARVTHTGRYVCVATNAAGLADSKYDLSVHGEWGHLGHVDSHHWVAKQCCGARCTSWICCRDAAPFAVLGEAQIQLVNILKL